MKRNIVIYVRDILQNMQDAEDFVQGLSYDQFKVDKKTFNAVLRAVEVVGEATKHIPADIREKYPAVPWKEMAGMRDKVSHFYFGVDPEVVWNVVKDRIPTLKPIIEKILQGLEQQP
jgi:uncharacterized protein with HEPN domain